MSEFTVNNDCGNWKVKIEQDGEDFVTVYKDAQTRNNEEVAAKIAEALNLRASLTPPEGIVASEKTVSVDNCKQGKWYTSNKKDFFRFYCDGGYSVFIRCVDDELEIISASKTLQLLYPALDLVCIVGDVAHKGKLTILGREGVLQHIKPALGERLGYTLLLNLKNLSTEWALNGIQCRRVPKPDQEDKREDCKIWQLSVGEGATINHLHNDVVYYREDKMQRDEAVMMISMRNSDGKQGWYGPECPVRRVPKGGEK